MYYEGGISSVYLWDLDHGFAAVILIKKAGDGSKKIKGCWDSIHVVEVAEKSGGRNAHYKLTSTVMLWLQTNRASLGTMNVGGSLTRQVETDALVSESSTHIANIGKMVEVGFVYFVCTTHCTTHCVAACRMLMITQKRSFFFSRIWRTKFVTPSTRSISVKRITWSPT